MPNVSPTDRANDSPDARAAAWCRGIRGGDPDAFAEFYRHWFDRSVAVVRGRTGRDESFALDVVQDAMIRVARSMPRLESEGDVSRWMIRVLTTCALDRLRKEAREQARGRRVGSDPTTATTDREASIQRAEAMELLGCHLAELTADQRAAIALRFWLGRSLSAIGRVFSVSEDAAHGRLRTSLHLLRRASEGDENP